MGGRAITRSSRPRPSTSPGGTGSYPSTCAGMGRATSRRDHTHRSYADDLAYLIEQLGLGHVVAVGHGRGVTVLQLAAAYPESVAAIVMVDPAPFVVPPERRARPSRRWWRPSKSVTRSPAGSSS